MLTLDGKRLSEFGLIPLQGHEHAMMPEIQRKTLNIPGRPGAWDFGVEIGERPFNIPIATIEHDRIKKQRKLTSFVAFLLDPYGQPREMKLVFDYEPDKHYMVKVSQMINPNRLVHAADFILPLVANDPYKYASANEYDPKTDVMYGEVGQDDYYHNPQSFDWLYPKHYSAINNYSSYVTEFEAVIEGTVTNPKITNLVDNKTLTLPSISNGRLEIQPAEVIKNGTTILSGSNYNFFHVQPGEVGFLFEGDNPNANVTYRWKHKFM